MYSGTDFTNEGRPPTHTESLYFYDYCQRVILIDLFAEQLCHFMQHINSIIEHGQLVLIVIVIKETLFLGIT